MSAPVSPVAVAPPDDEAKRAAAMAGSVVRHRRDRTTIVPADFTGRVLSEDDTPMYLYFAGELLPRVA